ncbi:hypothetical protein BDU57DRAFT_591784 [Ampelomyces quisqualis]|uniref:Uncharacterized protein n=1 Tax=Ampelomyces quisqualis TaxID=50730 RepID=A0A6A5QZT4_AMPQU|nr:hypothetical protein BDU57DRAFT_591784 [Ampelomyces quisqualis]
MSPLLPPSPPTTAPASRTTKPVVSQTSTHLDAKFDSNPNSSKTPPGPSPAPRQSHTFTSCARTTRRSNKANKRETQHMTHSRIVINLQHYLRAAFTSYHLPFHYRHYRRYLLKENPLRGIIIIYCSSSTKQESQLNSPSPTLTEYGGWRWGGGDGVSGVRLRSRW